MVSAEILPLRIVLYLSCMALMYAIADSRQQLAVISKAPDKAWRPTMFLYVSAETEY